MKTKKIKKWSRPDLQGKPMNAGFQLWNLNRIFDDEFSELIPRLFDPGLHLPENIREIRNYAKNQYFFLNN